MQKVYEKNTKHLHQEFGFKFHAHKLLFAFHKIYKITNAVFFFIVSVIHKQLFMLDKQLSVRIFLKQVFTHNSHYMEHRVFNFVVGGKSICKYMDNYFPGILVVRVNHQTCYKTWLNVSEDLQMSQVIAVVHVTLHFQRKP